MESIKTYQQVVATESTFLSLTIIVSVPRGKKRRVVTPRMGLAHTLPFHLPEIGP
jgi:hypothetical protein